MSVSSVSQSRDWYFQTHQYNLCSVTYKEKGGADLKFQILIPKDWKFTEKDEDGKVGLIWYSGESVDRFIEKITMYAVAWDLRPTLAAFKIFLLKNMKNLKKDGCRCELKDETYNSLTIFYCSHEHPTVHTWKKSVYGNDAFYELIYRHDAEDPKTHPHLHCFSKATLDV